MTQPRSATRTLLAAAFAVPAFIASAAPPEDAIFEQYCFRCHGDKTQSAGINLAKLAAQRPLVRNAATWRRVMEALATGAMPPRAQPQPMDTERRAVKDSLDQQINHFDYSRIVNPGSAPLRRLTHTEYNNTVRDLFGVDLKPAARFTPEMSGDSGFDNSANTLFLQSTLMERYIAAADRVVEDALPDDPTSDVHRRTRALIFTPASRETNPDSDAASKTLGRFLLRAYRRPPTAEESDRAMAEYRRGRDAGQTYERAIKRVLAATLISPKFLLRLEAAPSDARAARVTDWELASRLSYFLWASMPDDELFDLAARGKLQHRRTLLKQIERMLADSRADTLGVVFAGQWLGFQNIGTRVRMDPIDYPWCTDSLMDSMRAESAMFFLSLLRENQPIRRLIDANYTFLNQELASKLYGLKGVDGTHMRRVALEDRNRGGILGQPSILAITSNFNQTSPVKRGFWILDTVLGTPPPPPPENAGEFKPEVQKNKNLSFREKLAMHSSDKSCQGCHSKMDPLGFSMENFDYFGQWRDAYIVKVKVEQPVEPGVVVDPNLPPPPGSIKEIRKAIDARGILPDGTSFDGPAGLKQALLERRHDDLVRQTVRKMLAYALARQLEYYDEPAVRRIIADVKTGGYRFGTLLTSIVTSYPFQYKKTPGEDALNESAKPNIAP